jgi:hypothetical protein
MDLTSENLQKSLAAIFNVDPMYVVKKEGRVWNPQDFLPQPLKPRTWVAFMIEYDKPIDIAHFQGTVQSGLGNDSVQHRTANISLQFIGDQAETLALTVGHWIHRDDVKAQLDLYEAQLFGDSGDITSSDFYQDGVNDIKAKNVKIRIAWTSRIPTGQGIMPNIEFTGGTLVGT